jgi:hypothetical protein
MVPHICHPLADEDSVKFLRYGRGRWKLLNQEAHSIGHLRTLANPVIHAVPLDVHGCGLGPRIVLPYDLNRTAITGAVFLDHDDTVIRLLTRSNAR